MEFKFGEKVYVVTTPRELGMHPLKRVIQNETLDEAARCGKKLWTAVKRARLKPCEDDALMAVLNISYELTDAEFTGLTVLSDDFLNDTMDLFIEVKEGEITANRMTRYNNPIPSRQVSGGYLGADDHLLFEKI